MLGYIWGRSPQSISEYVGGWVQEWGEAGKDLSILPISAAFLEATCPQSYKDAGLAKVCAVPDGKDFMIWTPRSNTVLTRAAYSDKVSDLISISIFSSASAITRHNNQPPPSVQ